MVLLDPDSPNRLDCILVSAEFRCSWPAKKRTQGEDKEVDLMTVRRVYLELPDKLYQNLVDCIGSR